MGREFSNGFPLASLCNDDTDETRRALFRALRTRLTLSDVTDTRPVRGKRTLEVRPRFARSRRSLLFGGPVVRGCVDVSTFVQKGGWIFARSSSYPDFKLSAIPGLPLRPANRNRTDTAKLLTGVPYIRQIEPFI
jgi:hypothetical protein